MPYIEKVTRHSTNAHYKDGGEKGEKTKERYMLHYNYRPGYMYYDCVCGKRFTYTGNRIVFDFCCMGSIVYGC